MRVDKISISLPLFLSLLLVYLEAIFHIYEFRTLTGEIFFTVLFSAMGGILLGAFAGQPFDFLDVIGKNIMLTLMGIIVLAEYKLQLPDKAVLQKKLQELINMSLIEE